jgi:quercetin dioxygenase-like cupin family protein
MRPGGCEEDEMIDERRGAVAVVDLLALARVGDAQGPIWAHGGEDLNANLIRLRAGAGVAAHVNGEVEVLLVGIAGGGIVEVDGRWHELGAGQALVIPKGALRATEAGDNGFAYVTCHRRRAPLWPENVAHHPPGHR